MSEPEPPPCYRCGESIHDHYDYGMETCGSYVWPKSLVADALDLHAAMQKLGAEFLRPFARLVRAFTPRRLR